MTPAPGQEPVPTAGSSSPPLLRAVVLAGGDPLPSSVLAEAVGAIDAAGLVVAADAGLAHAVRLGRTVDAIVGDLDSVDPEDLAEAVRSGARVHRHPIEKDATDLALALDLVLAALVAAGGGTGARGRRIDVTVIGGHGGREDHLLANALLLGAERYAALRLRALWGGAVLHVVRDRATLDGEVDSLISLLALHGPAHGVTTDGLHFGLSGATLQPGSSLGLSNRMAAPRARISVDLGVLLAVQPAP
jgi:thiamine pyrophosphokinase